MFEILEGGTQPKIKTQYSSSADLYAREDIIILAGETKIVPLGVKIDLEYFEEYFGSDLPKKYWEFEFDADYCNKLKSKYNHFLESHFFELKLRSSLAKKLIIPNGVGEIDIDYPEEIGLMVHYPMNLETSELIAQVNSIEMIALNDNMKKEDVEMAKTTFMNESPHKDKMVYKIKAGERVAQIKLMEHKNFMMPSSYRSSEKRTSGFGSTGEKN